MPAKQTRTSVQQARARRYPALRRSDSQALDINATSAVIEHIPNTYDSVPSELKHHSTEGEDKAGSTDEESQDEKTVWDRRAKAHRDNMLFKRPRDPAPKVKRARPSVLIRTRSQIAQLESHSKDKLPMQPAKFNGTSEDATGKGKRPMPIRAARALKQPEASATPSVTRAQDSSVNTTTGSHQAVPATLKASMATSSATSSVRLQRMHSGTSSERPQHKGRRVRQAAIDAIAGHRSTVAPSPLGAPAPILSTTPLSSTPSQILRRSGRIASRQQSRL
ncbi:hypothetical protein RSOLAG22IIIB_02827 [Rhizoctonia solani]|uniref:Uncharacterized protein n=1 Tax=Rhizoctonia solani TaxID=456999 RepID=A0A0K6GHW6_9AGAM|nr:hypothetical protein RSOLAG22IIIB_02827 [Rhizoctonia solani]